MTMISIAEAVDRLTAAGYRDDFRAEADGLRSRDTGLLFAPEDLVVDEIVRFEGTTDPDEEAVVLAVRSRAGETRGTWTTAYGPVADPVDSTIMARLPQHRHR